MKKTDIILLVTIAALIIYAIYNWDTTQKTELIDCKVAVYQWYDSQEDYERETGCDFDSTWFLNNK